VVRVEQLDAMLRPRGPNLALMNLGHIGYADPQMVDDPLGSHTRVVDGFGTVAVRIKQECAVVVGRVLRARAWRTVIAVARCPAGLPERIDVPP
jgi:hypothetical protein